MTITINKSEKKTFQSEYLDKKRWIFELKSDQKKEQDTFKNRPIIKNLHFLSDLYEDW